MAIWIDNLRTALSHTPVVLLHGNVRDLYIDESSREYRNLTDLLRVTAATLSEEGSENCSFAEAIFLDPYAGERHISLDGPATEEHTTRDGRPDVLGLLLRWNEDLAEHRPQGLFAVVHYLDKLVSHKTNYQDDERLAVLLLEKLIENIHPTNRLVLVALEDTLFPFELYTNSPRSRVFRIPAPEAEDRLRFLANRLGKFDQLELASQLTEGLYLHELEPLSMDLQSQAEMTERELRSAINLHRVGVKRDYWGSIDLRKLDGASRWFVKEEKVKGQDEAIAQIMDSLIVARAGLSGLASGTQSKPRGVFFFAGPTGVGKTLIAKKLAKFLFGQEEAFIRLDMSEFKEEHTISRLLGSPPGYVGSERGGMLTNAVREKPFSVVLFDEIEKANPRLMDLFLQILDEGRLTDSRGQTVFFTETIIILTSNVGNRTKDFHGKKIHEHAKLESIRRTLSGSRRQEIREHFSSCVKSFFRDELSRPELLGRIGNNIVPFNCLDSESIQREILSDHLGRIQREAEARLSERRIAVSVQSSVSDLLLSRYGRSWAASGARGITDSIDSDVIALLANSMLAAEMENVTGGRIVISADVAAVSSRWEAS